MKRDIYYLKLSKFIEGLNIFLKYDDRIGSIYSEYEFIYINYKPSEISENDIKILK